MIEFYREDNGDFLAVETDSNRHYLDALGKDLFEGRAAAVAGLAGSVCTTAISRAYLAARCVKVSPADVPAAWRAAIGG